MGTDDLDLEALLAAVASGEAVDWDKAQARAGNRAIRAPLDALREVARVVDFHRALQGEARQGPDANAHGIAAWGDLLLLERVGTGASGEVYRGWDPALQREVAVKLLRTPDAAWLEEARALARVHDEHVVAVYGAREADGRAGLWMEFLRGPTLEQELARRGALPAEEVRTLGAQLARALAAVHAAGALHRDLKPANVVLEPTGRAVLTDFGVGRRAGAGDDARGASGTPLFMSPARLAGAAAEPRDDVYALGVTLWWALAGHAPFDAADPAGLAGLRAAAARGPATPLGKLRPAAPRGLVRAIERAMAPAAEARWRGAPDLAHALAATDPPARRAFPWLAGAGLVAGLALALAWAIVRPGRAPSHAVAPPAAAPVAPPYDVTATFERRRGARVSALSSGDRVAPGDGVTLALRATRPVWAYVLDADERGECYLLFPQPMFDRANPLPADSALTLPGARGGRPSAWTVTSAGGREHLLVITSPQPLPDLEAELAHLPAPVPGRPVRYPRVGAGALARLRGLGGVSDTPAAPAAPRSSALPDALLERVQALAGAEHGVRGTWMRQVVLENPAGGRAP